jgi:hypothetical protein
MLEGEIFKLVSFHADASQLIAIASGSEFW